MRGYSGTTGTTLKYTKSYTLTSTTVATQMSVSWTGITRVTFSTTGSDSSRKQVVVDDVFVDSTTIGSTTSPTSSSSSSSSSGRGISFPVYIIGPIVVAVMIVIVVIFLVVRVCRNRNGTYHGNNNVGIIKSGNSTSNNNYGTSQTTSKPNSDFIQPYEPYSQQPPNQQPYQEPYIPPQHQDSDFSQQQPYQPNYVDPNFQQPPPYQPNYGEPNYQPPPSYNPSYNPEFTNEQN